MGMLSDRETPNYEVQTYISNGEPVPEEIFIHPMYLKPPEKVMIDDIEPYTDNGDFIDGKMEKKVVYYLNNWRPEDNDPVRLYTNPPGSLKKYRLARGHNRAECHIRAGIPYVLAYVIDAAGSELAVASSYLDDAKTHQKASKDTLDQYNVSVKEGRDPKTLRLRDVLEQTGFHLVRKKGKEAFSIESAGGLVDLGKTHGYDKMYVALQLLAYAYKGESGSTTYTMIRALCLYLSENWKQLNESELTRLGDCLARHHYAAVKRELLTMNPVTSGDAKLLEVITKIHRSANKKEKPPAPQITKTFSFSDPRCNDLTFKN
jgi:hypothetical protein